MKKAMKILGGILSVIIVAAGIYVAYVFIGSHRIPDYTACEIRKGTDEVLPIGRQLTLLSWNIGFGAYESDYGFFMDGGDQSWAWSRERLDDNMKQIVKLVKDQKADLLLIQEMDTLATRTYGSDERQYFYDALPNMDSVYAVNWNSPFLFYPFNQPHGSTKTGIMTLSRFDISSALRRSLPLEQGISSIMDLDRCYSVSRIPTEQGRELCLYNFHLSAYSSDGKIADEQVQMLLADMRAEYEQGNYAVAGGDFNKDLNGNSEAIFGISTAGYSWTKPIQQDIIDQSGMQLIVPLDPEHPVPTCRNADGPYTPEQMVITVDGFLVSGNVKAVKAEVLDTGFAHSDHNPVKLMLTLD